MKSALILGSTGGIGSAVIASLKRAGIRTVGLSRADGLDWTDPERAERALLNADGPFDLIFDATGALEIDGHGPEKQLSAITSAAMAAQFAANAIGPALIFKHYKALLPRSGRSVIATVSARVGSIEDNRLGGWIAYRSAKAALNQIVKTASIEIARTRPDAIVVALHPGTVATGFGAGFATPRNAVAPASAAENMLTLLGMLDTSQTGRFFAYDGSEIRW